MTVRDIVAERKREMIGGILPARAREILVELTMYYGTCLDAVRATEHGYHLVLLAHLDSGEPANRAKIRAQTSPGYQAMREAKDTMEFVLETIRSLKASLRSLDTEMRELSR